MVPKLVLPPVTPLTCQVTFVLELLLTVAENACVAFTTTLLVVGDTETLIAAVMVTCAEAKRVVSATETALMVTIAGVGTAAGAV
jgi:hypothetical protein